MEVYRSCGFKLGSVLETPVNVVVIGLVAVKIVSVRWKPRKVEGLDNETTVTAASVKVARPCTLAAPVPVGPNVTASVEPGLNNKGPLIVRDPVPLTPGLIVPEFVTEPTLPDPPKLALALTLMGELANEPVTVIVPDWRVVVPVKVGLELVTRREPVPVNTRDPGPNKIPL